MTALLIILGVVIGFLINLVRGAYLSNKSAATILDLTNKIADKKADEKQKQIDADKAVKDYQDALKKYDPDFHGDDDSGGHSA